MSFYLAPGATICNNLYPTTVYRTLRMERNKKILLYPGVCAYLFGEIAFEF